MPGPVDTSNRFVVVRIRGGLAVGRLPIGTLTRDDALNLAAWLVTLAEAEPGEGPQFDEVLKAVRSS